MDSRRHRIGGGASWRLRVRKVALATLACLSSLLVASATGAAEQVLIAADAVWSFLDDGSASGPAWASLGFDDSGWAVGPAELGYGDGDEATVVGFGPDPAAKFITTYFRHEFHVADPAAVSVLDLRIDRDDGAAIYLNGVEVWRTNLPAGPLQSSTLATLVVGTSPKEGVFHEVALDPLELQVGTNVLAVEVHQANPSSSDISMELELVGGDANPPAVTRGPYLQNGSGNEVTVRWRTDVAHPSRVRFGFGPEELVGIADDPLPKTEHAVRLRDLIPGRRTYYAIGTTARQLAGGTVDDRVAGAALANSVGPVRIWVQGDPGTGNSTATAVADSYLTWSGQQYPDIWLMLGDNAYNFGTDSEYQSKLFDMFPALLRAAVLWPTLGNHDGVNSFPSTESGPYFDAFDPPRAGEAGGVPSGREAYYSFDYGDVHVICLESQWSSRAANGPMLTWLQADLAANTRSWTIAFWHHPPYSKGSHDSDVETQLMEMRANALPILEAGGVDLVLTGHSHSYERSVFLDGHYSTSPSLTPAMVLDGGDGDPAGDGAYQKDARTNESHRGAVYLAFGSSGSLAPGPLNHPVMTRSLLMAGSLVIDVIGGRLLGRFLNDQGVVHDEFAIDKTTDCNDGIDNDGDGNADHPLDGGCDSPTDRSELSDCADGFDNDGDGLTDFRTDGLGDPGCWDATGFENPRCQDGLDNDSLSGTDFDGGVSAGFAPDPNGADPQCVAAWQNREGDIPVCGSGPELAILVPLLMLLGRRRRA